MSTAVASSSHGFCRSRLLIFVIEDRLAALAVDAIVDAARSGNESGDGLVWTIARSTTSSTIEQGASWRGGVGG